MNSLMTDSAYNYLRVTAAMPQVALADCQTNAIEIISMATESDRAGADLIVFPELSLTGYTCGDLFHQQRLLSDASAALQRVINATRQMSALLLVGLPVAVNDELYNCAAAIRSGRLMALIPKTFIPNYGEFYEKRWWQGAPPSPKKISTSWGEDIPFGSGMLLDCGGVKIGVEICEDLWAPQPPSVKMALAGALVTANLSASDTLTGKTEYIRRLVMCQSASLIEGYIYCSAGYGESTTDMVFDSKGIIAENGRILSMCRSWRGGKAVTADIDLDLLRHDRMRQSSFGDARRQVAPEHSPVIIDCGPRQLSDKFSKRLLRDVDKMPFVPSDAADRAERCREILDMQSVALARRLEASHASTAVIGISGGLDSTLALIVATMAFDFLGRSRKDIIGVTMPGFGTTHRTHSNATELMKLLGCTSMEISIGEAVSLHFRDIDHDPDIHDVTYENCQARERTQILMDLSNRLGGIVIGTGDMSELALGWATYNGDHMSMYGVNAGVPKTLVKYLVETYASTCGDEAVARVLRDIIDTPISPELLPASKSGEINQKTEDLVGPYELHDFFLFHTLRHGSTPRKVYTLACNAWDKEYSPATIKKWLTTFYRRFFAQQFKRSCMPDGPKIGSVCLSPRGDWRMPSDACSKAWIEEAESL